jgi:hypothetical protein
MAKPNNNRWAFFIDTTPTGRLTDCTMPAANRKDVSGDGKKRLSEKPDI